MKKDNYITEVIFRKVKSGDSKGTIEAFFPYDISDLKGNITCYAYLGEHGGASWDYFLFKTIPAKESEYAEMKKHLELNYGYNLKIVKRRNYTRFLRALNEVRNR